MKNLYLLQFHHKHNRIESKKGSIGITIGFISFISSSSIDVFLKMNFPQIEEQLNDSPLNDLRKTKFNEPDEHDIEKLDRLQNEKEYGFAFEDLRNIKVDVTDGKNKP